ncbi:TPA: hypothetical protein ENX78_03465 [Candidatus Poribacteria bacterium]|nr:hypothetical protein [Candidatus Poribacteria bacterium]
MDFKHKNHLVSSYLTLQKQIKEISNTICEGRSPTGVSASLTPLPKNLQDAIMDYLKKVSELFEQLVKRYAVNELDNMTKKEPVSATIMWTSILLRQLQETVSDVHPKVFERKFGKLDPEERAYITDIIDQIIKELTDALKLV